MSDINYNPPRKITRESLHRSFNGLMESVERQHYSTFDSFGAQDLLRPVAAAIREAQRLVDIQIEKSELAAQEQRAANIQSAIKERKKKIAELEKA